ncbi:MAG: glutamine--tRNA ligase/YqeY domain fusion protein [Gammaproteobacteria bacterium]|nr:glutamine--tRNA ligase/YqeY domain fusion protein [Gammaproteobacteria bacterium]MBU1655003.1 glutamine--tRNA ligase/YqeY domain fusion protein [Gammaproteobacteria bacterium]MBU1960024.1 glutamine--tRNA ligase/YqeY domain fusion protein [Gammaproteobacteria bacterium]
MSGEEKSAPSNFIRQVIDQDLASGRHSLIHTRFPPEPNGYLHIGHAKSIVLNFGIAQDYRGLCNLRFDDTNPHKENIEFVQSIQNDVRWLGFDWDDRLFFASDYFERLYQFAIELIEKGKAFVCELDNERMREYRGTLKEPGRNSPYRDRSIAENLDLFQRMRAGEFPDGARVLRARIDMASPNINLRDPVLYRIRHGVVHHQTGAAWCLYPMYDYTHPISDALEGITHSLCTLEFEDHRPFYDWVLDNISIGCHPRQIEFSRLNLEYTVMSKRKLTQLVSEGYVQGWDDPRMPTLAGLRRRGFTPGAIREFCHRIGVTKSDNRVEMGVLESCIREDLDARAERRMAVLRPLRVVIENFPSDQTLTLDLANHPKDETLGARKIAMGREIFIDQADFAEVAPNKQWKRLVTGGEVRLRGSYVIKCEAVIRNDQGEIVELRCSYDPATLGANPEGRKVKGVIHWVCAATGVKAEVRLYDRLFTHPTPDAVSGSEFTDLINPASLEILTDCRVEAALADAAPEVHYQFEREGYFTRDAKAPGLVFNRTLSLRDSWAKLEQQSKP